MSTSHIIILSDSEDDYDNPSPTILLSDSDNESTHPEPMEEQSEQNAVTELEETMSETSTPPTFQYNYTSGPRVMRTARKRVAMPHQRGMTSPESSIPTHDPYINPASPTESNEHYNTKTWTWLPDTLKEWRKEEGFPTITEVGESSNTRQDFPYTHEPPHHTIPLLIARMTTHEQRIEHTENNVFGMQGAGEIEDLSDDVFAIGQNLNGLQRRVTSLEENLGDVGEATQEMMEKGQEYNGRTRDLESKMARLEQQLTRIEGHVDQLIAITSAAREYEAIIARREYLSKKD